MQGLAGLWRWQARRPREADAVLAAVVFAASVWGPLAGGGPHHGPGHGDDQQAALDVLTIALLAVSCGALALRRSHPLVVWAVSLLASVVIVVHTGQPPTAGVVSYVALYTLGTRAPLVTAVLTAVVTAAVTAAAVTAAQGTFSDRTLSLLAFTGAAAAVGVAVRSQRAAVEAAEARARQAESTREEEAERRVTDERLRIARELHDVVAHHISVINVQAGVARHLMASRPDQAGTALGLVRESSRTVLSEMSTVLGLLRTGEEENPTQPPPGLGQVAGLVETMGSAGLSTTWRTSGAPYRLSELADLTAYRIVQESLTNALKHGTGTAELELCYTPSAVVVEVRNPLRSPPQAGAPPSSGGGQAAGQAGGQAGEQAGGHGLVGMRERVASVGGRLATGAASGSFVVRAEVPREAAA